MDLLQNMFAERIGGSSYGESDVIYKFEKIKIARREAQKKHPDTEIIDLGVGQSDYMADESIMDELNVQARKWENRGYADNGIDEYKDAAARYMEKVFGVKNLNPHSEILPMIGSKPALAMLPMAFINPGDITLMTVPGYPVIGTVTEWLGGEVYNLPLWEKNSFYPDLDAIPQEVCRRAKLIYVNYPNNPTGQVATKEFFEKLVIFARKYSVIIVQDAAYAAVRLDGQAPNSILSIDGAMDIAVEIHSMSKAYNMTGWRLGFAAGNRKIISAIGTIKENMDSGQFRAIQLAGVHALSHPEFTWKMNKIFARRQNKLAGVLSEAGFDIKPSGGTFYMYTKAPKGTQEGNLFETAEDFSQYLIKEKLISTVPWDDAGHYIRFSATFHAPDEAAEDRVIEELKRRLADCSFIF